MSVQVYTAIVGGYDEMSPRLYDINISPIGGLSDVRSARKYKICSHEFYDTEYSLWIDGNILPTDRFDVNLLIGKYLNNSDIVVCKHRLRECAYDEALIVSKYNLDSREVINNQMARYSIEGYPKKNGLAETGVVLRRHTKSVQKLNESWWSEVSLGSYRDQLSFDYVCNKNNVKYLSFSDDDMGMFKMYQHNRVRYK